MKNAQIHFMKFYNFNFPTSEKMSFNTLFYFFGKQLARLIIFRLRVNISQEGLAYSARTDCKIINHYNNQFENELNGIKGEYVNYNCEVDDTMFDSSNAEFILNTDVPMTIVNNKGAREAFYFTEINFNGNTSDESSNIQENKINLEKYGI
jgi:hypothetical protein